MRYLVTGGAGFIGSHICDSLTERGHTITILDNLSTGRSANIDHIQDRVTMVHGSVMDALLVDELVAENDVVIHLAAAVGVRLIVEQPLKTFLTNIRGTETVLEAVHRYRRKVLIASTSEIYGKTPSGPFKEDDDRVLGSNRISRWGYSTSKAADEILAFAYHRERGVPAVIARLFNTVGPRQSGAYGMVLPRLAAQAVRDEPLTVYGDGQQTRCFCHVEDVTAALLGLLEDERAEGDVFNVGSTEEVSILELAERVVRAAGSTSSIRLVPYEEAYEKGFEDMLRRVPDISKIKGLIGWQPTRSLDEIIGEVVDEARRSTETGKTDD